MADRSDTAGTGYGWRVGSFGEVPIFIGRSWPIIAVAIVALFGPQIPFDPVPAYLVAAGYAVVLLISVLVHEIGHALAGRLVGTRVDRIVVNLWGGHTVFGSAGLRPGRAALVAVAGPVGNLLLAAVGWVLVLLLDPMIASVPAAWLLARALLVSNLLVAVFNLLPGLPLDGGHIVDALVWGATGKRWMGLIVAGWLGRLVTLLVVAWFVLRPLVAGSRPDLFQILWIGLIGAFLWQGAGSAIRAGRARRGVSSVPLSTLVRPVVAVPAHASIAGAVSAARAHPSAAHLVAVDPAGRPLGFLVTEGLEELDAQVQQRTPVTAVLVRPPTGWVVTRPPGDDLTSVVEALAGHHDGEQVKGEVLLVEPDGRLAGVVTLEDVEGALPAG